MSNIDLYNSDIWKWVTMHFEKGLQYSLKGEQAGASSGDSLDFVGQGHLDLEQLKLTVGTDDWEGFSKQVTQANAELGKSEEWTANFLFMIDNDGNIKVCFGVFQGLNWGQDAGDFVWSGEKYSLPDSNKQELLKRNVLIPTSSLIATTPTQGREVSRQWLNQYCPDLKPVLSAFF